MDNKQKLEFILRLERREKRRRIIIIALIIILLGSGIVFSQYMNMS